MKSSQLRFLLTTDHQNKLTEVYDTSFQTVPQIHLHFAKQPKFQHGVKAILFPRTFYIPPPSYHGHNFQRVRTVYSHAHM